MDLMVTPQEGAANYRELYVRVAYVAAGDYREAMSFGPTLHQSI